MAEDMDTKPTVEIPGGDPPSELVIEDLEVGEGDEAKAGNDVLVHYVGVAWSDGKQFDSSWDRGDDFAFTLGRGQVIAGWDQGVAGMREGGRRMLVIPPDLAYGETGQGPIAPNETLIFVIDLEKVT